MNAGPVRLDDVEGDRQRAAAENRRLAAQEEKEALYHAEMAACLSTVGDEDRARSERGQATVLRRAAQIKRDLATKCDPGATDVAAGPVVQDGDNECGP